MKGKGSPASHARGARAGRNAPATPKERLRVPPSLEARLSRSFPASGNRQR